MAKIQFKMYEVGIVLFQFTKLFNYLFLRTMSDGESDLI